MINSQFAPDARPAERLGLFGAAAAVIGVLSSGPLALMLVGAVHPQPPWVDARTFAEHLHWIQKLPFLCGLLLVGGFLVLVTSIHALTNTDRRALSGLAWASAIVFAALVSFNYILQTTFVPALARDFQDSDASLVSAFSMAHPGSLAWALEMWGYAFLGIATWLVAGSFEGHGVEALARWTFALNGPVSVFTALWMVVQPGWERSRGGLIGFAVWNLLALLMAASAFVVFRRRLRGYVPGEHAQRAPQVENYSVL
jgi:hypothetical protein